MIVRRLPYLDLVLGADAAQSVHHFGQNLDARARVVELASTVVRDDDALDAVVHRENRVLAALDALQHDGHGWGSTPVSSARTAIANWLTIYSGLL